MQLNKTLHWVIIGGLFLTPFLAFLVPYGMFFPFISGKNFVFRIIIEIVFALWLVLCIRDKSYWPRRSLVLYAAAVFLVVLAIADIFGVNPGRSFWANYERMEGLITHLHFFAYFLVAGSVLGTAAKAKSEALWFWLWHTSIGASLIMTLYGLLQLAGKIAINQSSSRVDGTFGNAAYMSIYLVFHIFLILYFAVREKTAPWLRNTYIAIALLEGIVLYNTATRGAILGLALGLLAVAIVYLVSSGGTLRTRKIVGGLLALLVVVAAIPVLFRSSAFVEKSPVLSRFNPENLLSTVKTRSTIWTMAYEGWKERPLLGWGQENYNLIFNKYYTPSLWGQEQWFDRAHNVFFDWLTAAGILGLLAYLALYGAGIYSLWKVESHRVALLSKMMLVGFFIAYFVHNFTVFDNLVSYLLFFTLLAYIHTYAAAQEHEVLKEARAMTPYKHLGVAIVLVGMVVTIYSLNVPGIRANTELLRAIDNRRGGVSQLESYKKALALDAFGTPEVREQLVQEALRQVNNQQSPQAVKDEFLTLAETEMKKQITMTPGDARYHVFLGSFYATSGRFDLAIDEFKKAHALSPQKQTIIFELANAYVNKKDFATALTYLEKAYKLDPSYDKAATTYAAGLLFTGKTKEADAFLKERFTTIPVDDALINAYVATKQYVRLAELWQERIRQNPTNGQYHVSLAATYLTMGERTKAIAALESAIRLSPQFKEQGEFYIKEIRAGRNP